MADVLEITRSALMRARSEISASVMPSAKYSCAGSFDTFSSGSTASERMTSCVGSGGVPEDAGLPIPLNAALTIPAEAGLSAASLLRHMEISRSSSGAVSGRSERTAGGALFRISNIRASARSLMNGLRPVAISNSSAPSA